MTQRRRVVASLVVVALVALAGCSSGPMNDATDADNTDAPTATTTKALEDLSFPDGVNDETVMNGTALAASHSAQISDGGYAVQIRSARSAAGESTNSTYVVRRDGETGVQYQKTVQQSNGSTRQRFAFTNKTATYQKRGTADPSYDVDTSRTSEDRVAETFARAHETLVLLGDWTAPNVVSRDGQTLVEYDLDGITADTELVDTETVTDASGSLLIDQRGVVHRVTVNVTRQADDTTVESHYEYRVTELDDVAVEKPDWVSNATEQHSPAEATSRVNVVATTGNVADGRVENVSLVVMRAPGGNDIDLSKATIQWVGPEEAVTLVAGDSATADTFVVDAVKDDDDSAPVINDAADRLQLSVDASDVASGLEAGDEVQLAITTEYGTKTTVLASVPEDISDNSVVKL